MGDEDQRTGQQGLFRQDDPGADPDSQDSPSAAGALDQADAVDPAELERLRGIESDLRTQLVAANARTDQVQRNLDSLLSQRPNREPADSGPSPDLNLPDPSLEPDQFRQQLGKFASDLDGRSARGLEQMRRELNERIESAEQTRITNELWRDFQAENPRYKGMTTFVASAFREEMAARGATSLPIDLEELKTAVKRRCDEMYRKMQEADQGKEPNRTAGVSGGSRGTTPAKPDSQEKPKTMSDQLFEMQEQMGVL